MKFQRIALCLLALAAGAASAQSLQERRAALQRGEGGVTLWIQSPQEAASAPKAQTPQAAGANQAAAAQPAKTSGLQPPTGRPMSAVGQARAPDRGVTIRTSPPPAEPETAAKP